MAKNLTVAMIVQKTKLTFGYLAHVQNCGEASEILECSRLG
jgi:hypothetical protein